MAPASSGTGCPAWHSYDARCTGPAAANCGAVARTAPRTPWGCARTRAKSAACRTSVASARGGRRHQPAKNGLRAVLTRAISFRFIQVNGTVGFLSPGRFLTPSGGGLRTHERPPGDDRETVPLCRVMYERAHRTVRTGGRRSADRLCRDSTPRGAPAAPTHDDNNANRQNKTGESRT